MIVTSEERRVNASCDQSLGPDAKNHFNCCVVSIQKSPESIRATVRPQIHTTFECHNYGWNLHAPTN